MVLKVENSYKNNDGARLSKELSFMYPNSWKER